MIPEPGVADVVSVDDTEYELVKEFPVATVIAFAVPSTSALFNRSPAGTLVGTSTVE